jgi:hypothetical protein
MPCGTDVDGHHVRVVTANGDVKLRALVPSYRPTQASPHEPTRVVIVAMKGLGAQLKQAA